jgi:2-succinyl-6-hydroxy-2,4-cyclohexadiene-1-carboxylate synthase
VAIVLVPGFTQTARSWDGVLDALGEANARALDIPTRPTFPGTARAVGDAGGAATYVGYSMGGRLCLRLALDQPELVRALVLVSASPGITDATERAARLEADERLAREVEHDGVDVFVDRWLAQPMWSTVPPDAPGLRDRRTLSAGFLAHCLRVLGTGAMEPMWQRLGELTMPVTLVTGAADTKFGDIARRMLGELRPGARHIELGCGHAVPLEQPRRLAEEVLAAVHD